MKQLIMNLDILNITPKFYINKREKFASTFGIFCGTFIILISISYIVFFVNEYLKRTEANIVFNEISSFSPSLNMTNVPFIFKLTNTKGDFYSEQIITFTVQHWKFEKLSNGTPSITTLNYERCNKTKHFQGYEKFFIPYYEQMKIDTYYCLNLQNYDLTINGLFGDLINGYSLINLYINECANNTKTNKTDCLAKEDLMKLIGDTNMFFRVSYIDFQIDHKNYSNPYFAYVRSENIQFSYKAKARVYYYLKNVFYNTDIGYFQRQMEEDSFFMYDTFLLTYPQVTYQIPNAFGLFSFLISSKAAEFNRSFPKLQSLIANIGGLINGSTFIFRIILHLFSKESIFLFYMNELIKPKITSNKLNCLVTNNKNLKSDIDSSQNNLKNYYINTLANVNKQNDVNLDAPNRERNPLSKVHRTLCEVKPSEVVIISSINKNFDAMNSDVESKRQKENEKDNHNNRNFRPEELILKNNSNIKNAAAEYENSNKLYLNSIKNTNIKFSSNVILDPYKERINNQLCSRIKKK